MSRRRALGVETTVGLVQLVTGLAAPYTTQTVRQKIIRYAAVLIERTTRLAPTSVRPSVPIPKSKTKNVLRTQVLW